MRFSKPEPGGSDVDLEPSWPYANTPNSGPKEWGSPEIGPRIGPHHGKAHDQAESLREARDVGPG